jgi:magnesium chelatase subunit D
VLCATAVAFGIDSLRAPILALELARVSAALDERSTTDADDLEFAARMVLAPRATMIPAPPQDAEAPTQPGSDAPDDNAGAASGQEPATQDAPAQRTGTLEDQVLTATRAAIPLGLLEQLQAGAARRRSGRAGRAGATVMARRRGRPVGVRAGKPANGTRLNVLATLRTAAPWQRLRRTAASQQGPRILVQPGDFRVTWFRQRTETVTVFAIDASGSSALHRLSEVKGAVELLLADCYVRRDQVAVLAFRGKSAELVLAPTRSLVRAKRCLASLPGGGTTPLAAGIDAACELAGQVQRRGQTPSLVILSDGQGNVARDGSSGRQRAQEDALQAARNLRQAGFRALLVDTAPRPQQLARRLAEGMDARYLPLPYADARSLAAAVQSAG